MSGVHTSHCVIWTWHGCLQAVSFHHLQGRGEGSRKGVSRRLVLTAGALLERRPATYEVAERRHLAALAAVVRFAVEPTWLGLEWTDGAPAAMYILPGRDALLAALLDAAQVGVLRSEDPLLTCDSSISCQLPGLVSLSLSVHYCNLAHDSQTFLKHAPLAFELLLYPGQPCSRHTALRVYMMCAGVSWPTHPSVTAAHFPRKCGAVQPSDLRSVSARAAGPQPGAARAGPPGCRRQRSPVCSRRCAGNCFR